MARAIDADELEMFPYSEGAGTEEQISEWIEQVGLSEDDTASRAKDLCWKVIDGFINVVKTQPTLTPPNEWVSVEERLPEESDGMVLFTNGKAVTSGYRNHMFRMSGEEGIYSPAIRKGGGYMRVTHWMPLPAPPDRRPPEGDR